MISPVRAPGCQGPRLLLSYSPTLGQHLHSRGPRWLITMFTFQPLGKGKMRWEAAVTQELHRIILITFHCPELNPLAIPSSKRGWEIKCYSMWLHAKLKLGVLYIVWVRGLNRYWGQPNRFVIFCLCVCSQHDCKLLRAGPLRGV